MSDPTRATEAQLSPDLCPNCGRRLKFYGDLPEGLCSSCGIYVEILQPSSPPREKVPVDDVRRRKDLAVMYLNLEDLAGPDDEPVAESPEPVPAPEPAPEEPPAQVPAESAPVAAPPPEATKAPKPEPAPSLPSEPEPAPEPVTPPPPAAPEPAPEPAPPPPVEQPAPVEEASDEAAPEVVEPPVEPQEVPEAEVVEESEVVEETEVVEEPEVVEEIVEEPAPPPSPEDVEYAPVPWEEVAVSAPPESVAHAKSSARAESRRAVAARKPRRRDRVAFYVGAVQVVLGGVGLLFGSFIHDFFRVPVIGRAYGVFGSFNFIAAVIGGILFLIGLGAMAAGARGGVVRPQRATGG